MTGQKSKAHEIAVVVVVTVIAGIAGGMAAGGGISTTSALVYTGVTALVAGLYFRDMGTAIATFFAAVVTCLFIAPYVVNLIP